MGNVLLAACAVGCPLVGDILTARALRSHGAATGDKGKQFEREYGKTFDTDYTQCVDFFFAAHSGGFARGASPGGGRLFWWAIPGGDRSTRA